MTAGAATIVSDDATPVEYAGLPVVGASFLRLDNGVEGIEIKRYGFAFDHAYTRATTTSD
jgi:hypothetical protein